MAEAFIGRTPERQRLRAWLDAAAGGEPVTILIDGDAGVGKTRLVTWFAEQARSRRALVLGGACIELNAGTGIPYGALVEAVRLFVRREGSERARQLAGPSWPALSRLIADFTGPMGSMATPDTQPRIFGAVLRLSDHLRRRPLVLILEDVHWADQSTLDLIRYLTKAKTDQRMAVVCTFRPVGAAVRHPLQSLLSDGDFRRRACHLSLAPFPRAELDEFVTALAGEPVAAERLQRYFELSEGNAYYAEQLVTAEDPGGPEVQVPRSLRALMVARINQLSDEAAELVRVAAVAGRRVGDDLLATVSDLDEKALDQALQECLERQILVPDGTDDAYAFEHALLRDTAYQAAPPRVRKRLHARIAAALAGQPGTTARLMAEVADHWFAAGRLPEALAAAGHAAEVAMRVHAFAEAEALYARVLRLWPDIPDAPALAGGSRQQVLGRAADAARWAGHVGQALDWVRTAIAEVDTRSEPGRAGELCERLGSYLWEAGHHGQSAAAYADAEVLLAALPPSAVASRVQAALATAAIRGGEYPGGLARAQRAAELARAVGARAEEGRALNSMGLALGFQGLVAEGEAALRAALAIAAEVDHLEDLFRAYGNLGVCLEHAGRLADVVAVMQEARDKAKEHGLLRTRQSGVFANIAAAALSSLGRYAEAADLLDADALDRPVAESQYARLTRAEICVAQGDLAAADRLLDQIRTHPNTDPRFVGPLYGCLAEAALWRDDRDAARTIVERGMAAVRSAGSVRVVAQLCAVGLRIAADLRGPADGSRPDGADPPDAALAWADELAAAVRSVAARAGAGVAGQEEDDLLVRQCLAERCRARHEDTPDMWAELAAGWGALERPFRTAYAQGWQADAYARAGARDRAAATAREAYAAAERIGAELLCAHIQVLANKRRLRLGKPRPYDLTPTELRVLAHVTVGRSNREIARAMFIAEKTVSIHVSNILRKLEVPNRVAAADLARREGLVAD